MMPRPDELRRRHEEAYDATLRAWPVPRSTCDVETSFGRTHVHIAGPRTAPPLVLIHGMATSGAMWHGSVGDLSRHHRVYAVDTIGDVNRSRCTRRPKHADDLVAWLIEVLDGLGLDRVHVVGISYGGWIAMSLARLAPERVDKLVLLSPASLMRTRLMCLVVCIAATLLPFPWVIRRFYSWMLRDEQKLHDPFVVQAMLAVRLAKIGALPVPKTLSVDSLRRIAAPTLLVLGEHEILYDACVAVERARATIPRVETVLIPGAGHGLELCSVNTRMVEFLERR